MFYEEDFASFSNLSTTDFDMRFEVQEVTTGSAFVIVHSKVKSFRSESIKKKQPNG
jgi:trans-2,3-dihydro-3-hydroxyanthranilate isomerase